MQGGAERAAPAEAAVATDGAVLRRLRGVRVAAAADAVLLAALLAASAAGARGAVSILGPLHGGNFLVLLLLTVTGAADRAWPWWFPAAVFATGGPLGALVGERVLLRRLRRAS